MIFAPHAVDFYKPSHALMYPEGTQLIYSNFTPRSDKHLAVLPDYDHKYVWFGLQATVQKMVAMWDASFFKQSKDKVIFKIKRRLNPDMVTRFSALHDLGYLPIRIKSLPEGSRVNIRVPAFTIVNTHPDFFWLTNYLETSLSAESWGAMTSATTAYEYRRLIDAACAETGGTPEFVPWQGHDFSLRGMWNIAAGTMSGAAHLLSFTGTDTVSAIDYLEEFYPDPTEPLIGGSVPATEHSVMCMGGDEDEIGTFKRLITELHPTGPISIVSDTWDFWKVVTEYTVTLKDTIMARQSDELGRPGKVILRPDSGDPVKIIVGDPDAEIGSPEYKGMIECLWEVFGGTITSKGFKTLDSHIGAIYGDSISLDVATSILSGLRDKGFSSDNIVFGIGSFTYQYVTRDSLGTAIKATYGTVNGVGREIFKNPKTDSGMKKSLKGLIRVEKDGDNFVPFDQQTWVGEALGELRVILEDGKFYNFQTLTEIRNLLHKV